jgi:hypothetical protein
MYFDLRHPPFPLLLILPHTVSLLYSRPIISIIILGADSAYERKHAVFDFLAWLILLKAMLSSSPFV